MEKSSVNMRQLAENIGLSMLGFVYDRSVKEMSNSMIEWARSYGAKIDKEQEEQAIESLKAIMPEPQKWPVLQIQSEKLRAAKYAPQVPGKPRRKKACDFNELNVPSGVEPPKCPFILKGGSKRAGEACGKKCSRVLDEHDLEREDCLNLECNHMFCGTHISKMSTAEIESLDALNSKSAKGNSLVVGEKKVDANILNELKKKQEVVTDPVMDKLLAKVKERQQKALSEKEKESDQDK